MSKNVLITGSAKRVGKEIALAFARDGWNIAVHHHTSSPTDVINEIEKIGAKAISVQADLNDFGQTRDVLLQANEQLGEINLLINSASIFEKCSFMDTDTDVFDRHMNINFKAPFYLSQDFARQCKGNGHIVNIIDTRFVKNKTTYFSYLLSKKSLLDLTKMLAAELGPKIRVNSVSPGALDTEQKYDNKILEERKNKSPLSLTPTKIALINAIMFLNNSPEITGQNIFLDGGENLA